PRIARPLAAISPARRARRARAAPPYRGRGPLDAEPTGGAVNHACDVKIRTWQVQRLPPPGPTGDTCSAPGDALLRARSVRAGGWRCEHPPRAGLRESPSPGPRPGRRWEPAVRKTLRRSAPVRPWGRRRESLLVDLLGRASRLDR